MLEDILRQTMATLQNQLPAKLDQIELERADGVNLEDVQSFLIGVGASAVGRRSNRTIGHLGGRQKYPSIIILGEDTTATNAISRRRELRHTVSIWIFDREVAPDSELPQTKLLRYVEAVERILASDLSLGGKAMDSTVLGHAYPHKGEEEFIRRAFLFMEVLERLSANNY